MGTHRIREFLLRLSVEERDGYLMFVTDLAPLPQGHNQTFAIKSVHWEIRENWRKTPKVFDCEVTSWSAPPADYWLPHGLQEQ